MRQFGVRPDRELGQNFLIDSNILGVIGRLAELSDADVVLEIGGGVGVLSEYLAERAAHVHVVELDERLREALDDAVARFANVTLHWGDALAVDLAGMRPAPTKVVANLPYGVAASALLRTIEELPTVTRWVAMVQREVGERLAAGRGRAGQRAYGVPSVLAQLACRVRVARAVPRTVFHPVPNVDSVLRRAHPHRTGPFPNAARPRRRRLRPPAQGARSLARAGGGCGGPRGSGRRGPTGGRGPPGGGRCRAKSAAAYPGAQFAARAGGELVAERPGAELSAARVGAEFAAARPGAELAGAPA